MNVYDKEKENQMEDNEWWGKLGVTPPEEGAREQEPAEPAQSTTATEGEKEQEVTEPAQVETAQTESVKEQPAADQTAVQSTEAEGKETKPQTEEERKEQARLRRQREQEARETAIRREETEKWDEKFREVFSALGIKDATNGGKQVETLEEFEQMQARQRSAQMQRDLKAGKLTPEALRAAVLDTPEVKEVLQAASDAKAAATEAEHRARLAQYNASMQSELAEIRKLNPAIKTTDDIIRMETGAEYARLLRTGLRPSEAYKLANFEQIQSSSRSAAEQAARNAAAGKAHLQPTPTNGQQPLTVPEEYKRNMRRFNDGITDEEIAKYYAESQK